MILKEFFGRSLNLKQPSEKDECKFNKDELFWFLLDHDELHKKYFFPFARKVKKTYETKHFDKNSIVKEFMPMVEQGCIEFYHKNKLIGKPGRVFPKDLREELCQQLYDHYIEDIRKDVYKIA